MVVAKFKCLCTFFGSVIARHLSWSFLSLYVCAHSPGYEMLCEITPSTLIINMGYPLFYYHLKWFVTQL